MSRQWACLLGQPVAHSLSPALHNAAFAALGIDAFYEARLVAPENLRAAVDALRAQDCFGANVTAPHKQAMLGLVDELSQEAHALGAVNTVINEGGQLTGANTDAAGLARWMRLAGLSVGGQRALVLGAGGAARSTVWALDELGASAVRVLNRTRDRADTLVAELQSRLHQAELGTGDLTEVAEPAHEPVAIVVNATSLGHHGSAPIVHPSWYSPDSIALELAYNPPLTEFMVQAQAAGARAENGIGMLLHQAALAFERWTGQAPPISVYEAALRQRVSA